MTAQLALKIPRLGVALSLDALLNQCGSLHLQAERFPDVIDEEIRGKWLAPGIVSRLRPTEPLAPVTRDVYRAHVRELLDRSTHNDDLRLATDAECLYALSGVDWDGGELVLPRLAERILDRLAGNDRGALSKADTMIARIKGRMRCEGRG